MFQTHPVWSLLATAFLITACGGSSGPYFWKKEGFTYQEAKTIEAKCRHEALAAKMEGRKQSDEVQEVFLQKYVEEMIEACMMMQGFRELRY